MTNETRERSSRDIETQELLRVIGQLAEELHPDMHPPPVTLDSSLDRDLGLDSLARMELLARLENIFAIRLPEQVLATAETPRDLLLQLDRQEIPPAVRQKKPVAPESRKAEDVQIPREAFTLVEVLEHHAALHPDRIHILLDRYHEESVQITYNELSRGAQRVAAGLQQSNLQPADTVAIILPTGMEYFFSFFGVLMAGGIPVPFILRSVRPRSKSISKGIPVSCRTPEQRS